MAAASAGLTMYAGVVKEAPGQVPVLERAEVVQPAGSCFRCRAQGRPKGDQQGGEDTPWYHS